tara:strand:+ start:7 stop:852 length:846 start_codon:yes stop_codon:yes gene_type:complete
MLYINSNDKIIPNDKESIKTGNRSYLYGDGVFESIRIIKGRPINLENHISRLLEGAKMIMMETSEHYNVAFFRGRIIELLFDSGIKGDGRCRLSLDRKPGGTYAPSSNDSDFYIEVYPITETGFSLNEKGKQIEIYTDYKRQKNKLSNFKTKNGLLYVLASISAQRNDLEDYLLTNEAGGILESTNSNLFVVSNGILYTPGLDEGCLAGTMRMQVINLAISNGIKIYECNILPQNLLIADEVFLTNAIQGVQWVGSFRTKRYFNVLSKRLNGLLNEKWLNE